MPCSSRNAANGGERGAGVAQQDGAGAGHEGDGAEGREEVEVVVGRIGLGKGRELARHGRPIELAAFDNHAAERGAVAADELRGGLHHDVGAVLQRAEQVRGGEGVVDDKRQVVLVRDVGDGLDVGQVGVGVAEGLDVDELRVVLDGILEVLRVARLHEGGGHAIARERVAQQVEGAAVDVLGGHDVVAGLGDVAHRVFDGRGAGCDGEAGGAAFESGDAVLEHALGGVGQAAVDVARVLEAEASLGVVEIMEDVARGGVDRDRAGIGRGVRLLLSDMQLQGLETIVVVLFCHGGAPCAPCGASLFSI